MQDSPQITAQSRGEGGAPPEGCSLHARAVYERTGKVLYFGSPFESVDEISQSIALIEFLSIASLRSCFSTCRKSYRSHLNEGYRAVFSCTVLFDLDILQVEYCMLAIFNFHVSCTC